MLHKLLACIITVVLLALPARGDEAFDVVVYGGTAGGVVAAVQAGRMGKRVVLIEPLKHLGGMTTGGLGATDTGNANAIAGVSREFYRRVREHYQDPATWRSDIPAAEQQKISGGGDAMFHFEPRVAEKILNDMAREAKVTVVLGERLDLKDGVKKDGPRIVSIKMESGRTFAGKQFIDAGYEGDVLAKAGVSYMVGRESNAQYDEHLEGFQGPSKAHQFKKDLDPYVKPGDPSSGLLLGISAGPPGEFGKGDKRVQAYNYRLCMSDRKDNQRPFPKPEGYDPARYELLLRYLQAGVFDVLGNNQRMPNGKTDTNNNGGFSSDDIGMNYDYPDGDYATRARVIAEHINYHQGLMYFLVNDPRVPEKVRAEMSKWGLPKDEFTDTGGWPFQLYVREGRRMIGAMVMTEHEVQGERKVDDSVGLGSYGMDSHNTSRYVDAQGHPRNEGDVQIHGFPPYGISYRSLTPRASECTNLLVPVCMSATHMAYGSIRMEPVYMILGQSCGTAAVMAIDDKVDVQKVDYAKLRERLLADKQLLEWTGGGGGAKHAGTGGGKAVRAAELPGVVVDDKQAKLTGDWSPGSFGAGIDGGYQHDENAGKGHKSARFDLKVPADGKYEVRFAYVANPNRATNVPVTVTSTEGQKTVHVNERTAPPIDGLFVSLGTFNFTAASGATVTVGTADTDGHVIIDGVQIVPAK